MCFERVRNLLCCIWYIIDVIWFVYLLEIRDINNKYVMVMG